MKLFRDTLAAAVAALAFSGGSSAIAGEEKVLKLASFLPPVYVLHKPIFEEFASDLEAATDGSVRVEIYPSGELGKGPVEQYKRAVSRIAEISYGLPGYTSSIFPKTLLVELPGVSSGHEDATAKIWKVMDEFLRDEFKKTVPLALFVTPPAVLMMTEKPIRSLEDLDGLKIRVASASAATVIESYGATPVPMPANKVYTAMNTGVVDGALMGSDSLLIFKLIEITNFVTTNLPEMPTAIFLVANEEAYGELTDAERAHLDDLTGLDMSQRAAEGLANFGELALERFAAKEGAETIVLSDEVRATFDARAMAAVGALKVELDARGIPATAVIAAMVN
ncbi:MAG: TRAP transporter substrate-binding protein [Paracoccaceae bacterium]|nr:TRAP transporter substrate-binding protein [Paracoccaceae bacterium]